MNVNDYQQWAKTTRLETADSTYLMLGLVGEVGELYSVVAKSVRDENISNEDLGIAIVKEMGDIMWFLANIAEDMGVSLSTVLELNIAKLEDRKKRDAIKGSGDER
jgi:NTP pyrophosphatase (non-canonical NTP hydrolase)